MDLKLNKWIRWLKTIKAEVQDLVMAKHMFGEVRQMIVANPAIRVDNSYYRYLANSYASYGIIGVRRQVKVDQQGISFARLLTEMSKNPQVLSRKYYVSLYEDSIVEDLAEGNFDRYAAPGISHIRPTMPEEDLDALKRVTKKCEVYADKRIAHRDKSEPKEPPTYCEIDDCIDCLDVLYVKYFGLFHACHMDTLLPTWQYDWKTIFTEPWLQRSQLNRR